MNTIKSGYRTLLACCISFLMLSPAFAAKAQDEAFAKANALYARESYPEALEAYRGILETGVESWELYYNMGNTYYRMVDYPKAILYYEKAAKLYPGNPIIENNLKLTEQKIVDRFESMPVFFLNSGWNRCVRMFTTSGWAVAVIAMLFVFLLCAAGYKIGNSYTGKKIFFYTACLAALLLVFSLCCSIGSYKNLHADYAVVMQTSVAAKSSPEERSETKFMLHEGSKVMIEESIPPYCKVRIKNGNRGWIPEESLERI